MHADKTRAGTLDDPATVSASATAAGSPRDAGDRAERRRPPGRQAGSVERPRSPKRQAQLAHPAQGESTPEGESPRRGVFDLRRRDVLQLGQELQNPWFLLD